VSDLTTHGRSGAAIAGKFAPRHGYRVENACGFSGEMI
jgi:hypothetical protein